MSDNASETDPISSSVIETPTSADESEIVAEEQLIVIMSSAGAANSNNKEKNITTERCKEEEEEEVAKTSVGDEEKSTSELSLQEEEGDPEIATVDDLQNPKDDNEVATPTVEENITGANNTQPLVQDANFGKEVSAEVTDVLKQIVNEVDKAGAIIVEEPKQITIAPDVSNSESEETPITPDENKGEDLSNENSQAILKDDNASIESDTPTDATPPKNNAPKLEREILFTDPRWSQRWAAIHDKTLAFAAPVLRVESGRFFWSSETYNKRILAIYKQPELILILRLPVDSEEVKGLRGENHANNHSQCLVTESIVDPKTSKIRLSQLTHPTSLPLKANNAGGLQNVRKRTCFDILTPTEVIEMSAAFLPDDSFDNIEYASEKCLSDTYRFQHAISESLLNTQTNISNEHIWRHQIILGTPHSYVIGGNDQKLKEALGSALELQKSRGGGNNKLDSNIIDEIDTSGNTALHYACRSRRSSTVGILVSAGSDCTIQTQDLKTPCHLSAECLDAASLSIILSAQKPRPDPNALDSNLRTPMCVAAVEGIVAGKSNANALDQCLSALSAWGGQLTLGSIKELHPIHLAQWKSAELGVILSHCHYHYPLLSGLPGISVSALYHYPLHAALIYLREQIYSALRFREAFVNIPSEVAIVSRLQTLLIHGFEPNERLEGVFCEGKESKRLSGYFGFTPLQILIASAIDVKVIDSSNHREKDAEYIRGVKNIIETIQSCAKTLLEKGSRINLPPPPLTRLDRDTPPGCYALKDAMQEAENGNVPPVIRDGLKLDNNQVLTLLGGADRLKSPQKIFASLPKSVDSVGTLQFVTSPRDSDAPGGSDDASCAVCWSEFGIIANRKHLCRASGRYVCNDCSTKRVLENGTEQRITDGLFNLASFERKTVGGTRKSQVSSHNATSRLESKSSTGTSTSTSDRNRSFLGLSSSSTGNESDAKEQRSLSATERITSAFSGLGQAKDAVIERGAKLEGLAEKTEKLNNASVDFMNMAKELERQQNSWW